MADADGLFDIVLAFHSVEHLDELLAYLKALAQRLVPGTGRLAIEGPHAGAIPSPTIWAGSAIKGRTYGRNAPV